METFYFIFGILFVLGNINGSQSVSWPCDSSANCTIVPEATCSPNTGNCRCPAGHVFSSDVTRCIKESLHGEACQESVQCAHMLNGFECSGTCTCVEGFTYIQGKCRILSELGGPCDDDIQCNFGFDRETVECKNNICECAPGSYKRTDNICRRISMLGEPCVVQTDCPDENLVCNAAKFVCEEKTKVFKNAGVQTSIELINGIRKILKKSVTINEDVTQEYGDVCTTEQESNPCTGLPHSVCKDSFCVCQPGYFPKNKKCYAELGEKTDSIELCPEDPFLTYSEVDKKCGCGSARFYNPSLRTCNKPLQTIATSCTVQSQCSPFNSICPSVSPRQCRCADYNEYNPVTELCEPKVGLQQYCEVNADCTLAFTSCNTDTNTCDCHNDYIISAKECKAGINAPCETKEECFVENSECVQLVYEEEDDEDDVTLKACQCSTDFLYYKDEKMCVSEAKSFGDDCIIDEQCEPLLGERAVCLNKKCDCKEADHLNNGKCYEKKQIGERCSRASECFVEENMDRVECRNAVCTCKYEFNKDSEKQQCIRIVAKNSSSRPSALKAITIVLITTAFIITSAAIREAYYL